MAIDRLPDGSVPVASSKRRHALAAAASALMCLALSGCVTTTTTTGGRLPTSVSEQSQSVSNPPRTTSAGGGPVPGSDLTAITDPSAQRLGDIITYLLLYFSTNRHLPPQLMDLTTVIPAGAQLSILSPVSQQPYDYNPTGLQIIGQSTRLILHDPRPDRHGMRWAVLLRDAGDSIEMFPVHLTDKQFSEYRPAIPTAAPAK